MKSGATSHYRVLLVFAGFVLIALSVLWVLGGRESTHTIEVSSSLDSKVLQERFEQRLRQLRFLDQSSMRVESIRQYRLYDSVIPVSMLGGLPGVKFPPITLPFADIVFPDVEDSTSIFDPAVVFMDTEFRSTSALSLEWFGRDTNFVYLRELDPDQHVRLIKMDTGGLAFSDADGATEGSIVRYTYVIQHSGFQRLYGKLFERNCENSALTRLQWVCRELEAAESG